MINHSILKTIFKENRVLGPLIYLFCSDFRSQCGFLHLHALSPAHDRFLRDCLYHGPHAMSEN